MLVLLKKKTFLKSSQADYSDFRRFFNFLTTGGGDGDILAGFAKPSKNCYAYRQF